MADDESAAQSLADVLDDDPEASAPTTGVDTRRQRRSLVAFIVTVAVVVGVVAMLPIAITSMASELRGQATDHVYDLLTGADIDASEAISADAAFVNITATGLEEARRFATLTVFRTSRLSGDLPADHRHVLFAGE